MTTASQIASTATNSEVFSNGSGTVGHEAVDNDQSQTMNELNKNENAHNESNATVSSNGGANNLRGVDVTKRKKLKSRNIPIAPSSTENYSKDHLDAWLETCLKDVSQEQLSSSSEFLDYNPTLTLSGLNNVNKQQQQQQRQLQHGKGQKNSLTHANTQRQHYGQLKQTQQQQQPLASQPNFGNFRNDGKVGSAFMTGLPNSAPFSQGFQRSAPSYMRPSSSGYNMNRFSLMFPPSNSTAADGFYGHLNDGSQDFASLPPIVNLLSSCRGNDTGGVGSSEHENNSTDVLDGSGINPNMSRGFRFSDPCLLNPSDNDSKLSGQNTPDCRQNVSKDMENNKFFTALMEQINLLHETNSKICRNLHETKVDIETLKHAPNWGMRHRRDSLSGLSTHSQPMIFGGGFGTQSPAPTYHSGAYTPGMMTDVVREVKEAARVREDALLNRVKALVEERQWSMNETNLRMMRDIEELKSQINYLRSDRKDANKRINHLEAENKYMRQLLASVYNSNRSYAPSERDIIYEQSEKQRMRKQQMPHTRRAQSLNLHYGTIHHQASSTVSLDEQDEQLHIVETPTQPHSDIAKRQQQQQQQQQQQTSDMRNSLSSSEGSGGGGGGNANKLAMSPPRFALVSSPITTEPQQQTCQRPKRKNKENSLKKLTSEESLIQQQELSRRKSTESVKNIASPEQLQHELTEAVAARQKADERIIAIEKLVRNLHVNNMPHEIGIDTGGGINTNNIKTKIGFGNKYLGATNTTTTTTTTTATTNSMPHMQFHITQQQPMTTMANDFCLLQQHANEKSRQQHQQHQQQPEILSMDTTVLYSPPKLSVAGPITDL